MATIYLTQEDGAPYTERGYVAQAMHRLFPYPHADNSQKIVIILDTYLDESGTDAQSPTIVVAGVASTNPNWEKFSAHWQLLLDEWGIEFFHMADFENRQRHYANWSIDERHDRLNKLLSLFAENVIVAVWAAVPKDVYDRVIPNALKARINPYHIAAISAFSRLTGILRNELGNTDVQAAYIYEEIGKGKGAVLDAYSSIKGTPGLAEEAHMLSLSYQPKQKFLPLQAADILAYEVWKDTTNKLAGHPRDRRYPIRQLEQSIDIRPALFQDNELQLLLPILTQVFLV